MALGNTNFGNDAGTGTVGADGFLGPMNGFAVGAIGGSAATSLTAHAGGTQAAALLLTSTVNGITTVGTAADSVALPLAIAGTVVYIANTTVTSAQVFGSGTDTINSVATATGVALAGGKNASFFCLSSAPAGAWRMILSA